MENQDGLYDDLPQTSAVSMDSIESADVLLPLALNPENKVSLKPDEGSSSSELCSDNLTKNDESNTDPTPVTKSDESKSDTDPTPVKRCPCRDGVQWKWESSVKSEFVKVMNDNIDVKFHSRHSSGTAIVRCTEPMSDNQYYWEVKMTYPVYGTDIMVGVGTSDARMQHLQNRFLSLLGRDSQTWGYSYTGMFHHNGKRRYYAASFGQGNVIGVHLDLWRGTLSFYKDRKFLGVASTDLKGKTLYAMASSTAARSGMRIIQSSSFPSTLQFQCCAKLRELIPDDQNVLDVIDIPPGLKAFLHSKLDWLLSKRDIDIDLHNCCPLIESQSDDEEVTGIDRFRGSIPHGIANQCLLLGSFMFGNVNRHNRIRLEDLDFSQETMAKRLRRSFGISSDSED